MQATYLHAKGNNKGAIASFQKIMQKKSSKYMLEPYIHALFDGEQFPTLIKVYEKNKKEVDTICEKQYMIKAYLAQAYLSTNNEEKAQELFDTLMREHGNDMQLCYFTAVGHLKTKRLKAAIELLQKCIANDELKSKHYLFHFLLSKAQLEANHPHDAMVHIEQSIAQFPKFERGWLFKAILLEQQGKINDAITGYKKFLDIAGRDQSIEKQLIGLLFNQHRYAEAAEYLQKLSSDAPEYTFDLALVQSKSSKYDEALVSINKVLIQNPTSDKAKLLKLEILLNSEKVDEAVSSLQSWLEIDPSNMGLLHTFSLLLQGGIPAPKLITALEHIHNRHPNAVGISAALGDLLLNNNQQEKSLAYYAQVASQAHNTTLKSKAYFQRCYIMLQQKNYPALIAELDTAEREGCFDHALLNLQAYYFYQTNQQLDRALTAINKALKMKPNTAAYLDTKAQILSAKGHPQKALLCSQKALSLAPTDGIIQQHTKELEHYAQQPCTSKTYVVRCRR
ncbi:hypothetical protein FJ364_04675 [Candidatus Dependentiae bacterium]|nr:hypothetical protein [Candidatus Dependentiae bacterium]